MLFQLFDFLQEYHDAISALGLIVAGLWALREYRLRRIAQRKSLAAECFEKFKSNPDVVLATRMMDWEREFDIGAGIDGQPLRFKSTTENLEKALRTANSDSQSENFLKEEVRVRDIFDVFFTELDMLGASVESKLLKPEDVSPFLRYWVDIIKYGKGIHGSRGVKIFATFMHDYRFDSAVRLVNLFPPIEEGLRPSVDG